CSLSLAVGLALAFGSGWRRRLADALDRRRTRRVGGRRCSGCRGGGVARLGDFARSSARARRTLAGARSRRRRARAAAGRTRAARTRTATVAAIVLGAGRRVDRRRLAIGEAVAAVDPAFDADDAVRGLRFR